ncbi:S9 family peptidase [Solihabitans fulvus]|uniref:S9 family peptidase n=1 Tax=Solihabitans fulvus TaxID=1892852 RepID=A0A5B2WRC3_9PSEU|nr:prolyl oligopeptidase family serine peptidase [Solihabitans fulvus]KAA2254055.1 S9 family peptidase [Solihabitans fulvus]
MTRAESSLAESSLAESSTTVRHVDALGGGVPSPDGRTVAYVSDAGGRPQVWLRATDGSTPARELSVGGVVTRCVWRPDGTGLLVQTDPTGAEDYQLAELDPATGEVSRLADEPGVRHEIGIPYGTTGDPYSPDGMLLAYASNSRDRSCFDVLVRDLATGVDRLVLRGDDRYLPVCFSPDSRRLLVLRLHQNTEHDLFAVDLAPSPGTPADDTVTHLTPHDGPSKYLPIGWSEDGIYLCATHGRDFLGVALLAPDGEWRWLDTPDHDVEGGALSRDGRWLAWGVNVDGYTELVRLDLRTGDRGPVRGLPRGMAVTEHGLGGHALRFTDDGSALLVQLARPDAATELYLADLATGGARRLTDAGRDLPGGLVTPEIVRFDSADGLTVDGLLYRPSGEDRSPVVVLVHGGPEFRTYPAYDPLIHALLANGIGVLAPNVRGSSGRGMRYQRLVYRDWGGGDLADLAAAAGFLRGVDWADGDRLGVYGASYGGFAALSCLTRLPELWRAGVSECGPSDLIDDIRSFPPTWRLRGRDWIGDPDDPEDAAMLIERSPLHNAHRLRAPLLLMHGSNDTRVAVENSDRMFLRLTDLGLPVRFEEIAGEGHVIADRDSQAAILRTIVAWFVSHL